MLFRKGRYSSMKYILSTLSRLRASSRTTFSFHSRRRCPTTTATISTATSTPRHTVWMVLDRLTLLTILSMASRGRSLVTPVTNYKYILVRSQRMQCRLSGLAVTPRRAVTSLAMLETTAVSPPLTKRPSLQRGQKPAQEGEAKEQMSPWMYWSAMSLSQASLMSRSQGLLVMAARAQVYICSAPVMSMASYLLKTYIQLQLTRLRYFSCSTPNYSLTLSQRERVRRCSFLVSTSTRAVAPMATISTVSISRYHRLYSSRLHSRERPSLAAEFLARLSSSSASESSSLVLFIFFLLPVRFFLTRQFLRVYFSFSPSRVWISTWFQSGKSTLLSRVSLQSSLVMPRLIYEYRSASHFMGREAISIRKLMIMALPLSRITTSPSSTPTRKTAATTIIRSQKSLLSRVYFSWFSDSFLQGVLSPSREYSIMRWGQTGEVERLKRCCPQSKPLSVIWQRLTFHRFTDFLQLMLCPSAWQLRSFRKEYSVSKTPSVSTPQSSLASSMSLGLGKRPISSFWRMFFRQPVRLLKPTMVHMSSGKQLRWLRYISTWLCRRGSLSSRCVFLSGFFWLCSTSSNLVTSRVSITISTAPPTTMNTTKRISMNWPKPQPSPSSSSDLWASWRSILDSFWASTTSDWSRSGGAPLSNWWASILLLLSFWSTWAGSSTISMISSSCSTSMLLASTASTPFFLSTCQSLAQSQSLPSARGTSLKRQTQLRSKLCSQLRRTSI